MKAIKQSKYEWLKLNYQHYTCVLWPFMTSDGYPTVSYKGKKLPAHRLALILMLGRNIEKDKVALRRCGNKLCISSSCLYEGNNEFAHKDCYAWLTENHNGGEGCVIWPFSIHPGGYAVLTYQGKKLKAHRISLEIKLGRQIQPGLFSCHTCDTPACVNSNHLFEGTNQDNIKDMINKNRQAKGTGNNPKLTEEQVLEIRHRYANEKISTYKLGEIYGVTNVTIGEIIRRVKWKHI